MGWSFISTTSLRGQPVSSAEKKRVLVLDDEYVIADTLVAIFSQAGRFPQLRRRRATSDSDNSPCIGG